MIIQEKLTLKEGWNLISGLSKVSVIEKNDLIVENTLFEFDEAYKRSVFLYPKKGYWIRSKSAGEVNIKTIYDFIIVGGGPGGTMAAYKISEENPDKTILLLEQNVNYFTQYKNKDYTDAFKWNDAMNDSDFQYAFESEDSKSVWMGKGLGGGTLHFGLQYIDQSEIINEFNSDWSDDFESVSNILNPKQYTSTNSKFNEIKNAIESSSGIDYYNNKIYVKGNTTNQRLLIGDLINDKQNITILYGKKVTKLNKNDSLVSSIEDLNGELYYASNFIISSGAIQTPAILQRSGIDCGNKLYDHLGFSVVYGKFNRIANTTTTTVTEPHSGPKTFKLNTENIAKINEHSGKIVRIAAGTKNGDDGKVYDFTEWASKHGGGYNAISSHTGNYVLTMQSTHTSSYWTDRSSSYRTYIGVKDQIINYDTQLPSTLHSESLENDLFQPTQTTQTSYTFEQETNLGFQTDTYLSYIQTRDQDLNWQCYYSVIPNNDAILITTHALSTDLSGLGSVSLNPSDENGNPSVTLNYFGDNEEEKYLNYLKDSFDKNHAILSDLGYTILGQSQIDSNYIKSASNSIYHYHGSCAIGDVVDENLKVNNFDNLYIADASVFNKPWGGSTSVPSLVAGYRLAKNFSSEAVSKKKVDPEIKATVKNNVEIKTKTKKSYNKISYNPIN